MLQWCNIVQNLAYNTCKEIKLCHCIYVIVYFLFSETELSHDRLIFIDKEKAWHKVTAESITLFWPQGWDSLALQNRLNDSDRIGFFRDTWRFSDGSSSSYRNWEHQSDEKFDEKCAIMNTSGKWY